MLEILDIFLLQEMPKGRSFSTFKFMHGFTGLYTLVKPEAIGFTSIGPARSGAECRPLFGK
jgi:hypothetical protein